MRIPRLIGVARMTDMMLTGRVLSAEEALAHGLVTRLVAADAVDATVAEITATIVKAPPAGLRMAKRCIDQGMELDPRGALATELLAIEEILAAAEWRKAMAGFGKS